MLYCGLKQTTLAPLSLAVARACAKTILLLVTKSQPKRRMYFEFSKSLHQVLPPMVYLLITRSVRKHSSM